MNIYINDELVDVQLENEKTSMELYDSLQRELKKYKKYIYDFKLKKKDSPEKIQTWNNIPLSEIDSIYFYVGSFQDMLIDTLYSLNQYIDDVGTKIFESESLKEEEITELREGMNWIFEFIYVVVDLLNVDFEKIDVRMPEKHYENLKENVLILKELVQKLTNEDFYSIKLQFIKSLRVIRSFSMKVFNYLLSKNISNHELIQYLNDFEAHIEEIQKDLIDINTHLQMGNDQKALFKIQNLFDQLEFYFFILTSAYERINKNPKINSEIDVSLKQLMEVLKDLSSALNDMDIVAVGDILEYELSEKILSIKNHIPELKNSLTSEPTLE